MDTTEYVSLPSAPAIPGLRFRRWHDIGDYQELAAVREGSREWDRVDVLSAREDVPTAEDIAASFPEEELRGSSDLLLAEIDDQVIGYNHVFWRWTEVTDVPTFDPELCQVAWVDDDVVGFVLSRIHKGVGMIAEVAVRKVWQRRGIALSLMIPALNALHARGMAQVRLFTDADDGQGARRLYERVGFREVKQHIFYRKPFVSDTL